MGIFNIKVGKGRIDLISQGRFNGPSAITIMRIQIRKVGTFDDTR